MRIYIGLGSNLGDRLATLRQAVRAIAALEGVELRACSSPWETSPLGPGSGPFLNAALELLSFRDPPALLDALLSIEVAAGRVRRERWGDRTLDLDMLCAFDQAGEERTLPGPLHLPHPGVVHRDFVLRPLLELAPQLCVDGRSCADWLAALPVGERTVLHRLDDPLWMR
ncbi:2-amino-4-hydroxy-6-hydroxymethyldihydropteridine diphosphokinase [Pseudenhygromyxa sp. WMMC2535]|nr:2-amino-4-hydroxy-6-hydroxymethyldihydropteridine diphosphokinase [Pseudenhygromyxa sp. WMMC2535]NVB38317.1 2-amino-4-hydroxy-6-hydroxymethyldihydropteridine diphosphokinase [Pseudenhygromyxa sp. WMMC2535]